MTKEKNTKKKQGLSAVWMIGIGTGVIVLITVLFIFSSYRNSQKQKQAAEEARQSRIASQKAEPKIKDFSSDEDANADKHLNSGITQKTARQKIRDSIDFAFYVMAETDADSDPDSIRYKNLNAEEQNKFKKIFVSKQPFEDFNSLANMSSTAGEMTYDGYSGRSKTYKTPKRGTLYRLTGGTAEYDDSDNTSYHYDVEIRYEARGYDPFRQAAEFYVRKSDGKIMQIAESGN